MPIQLVHVSDIHFGSGEGHGRLNPQTGLNVRFEDFVQALSRVVDYTLENKIDVFLFSGDAYRNALPEPVYQKMFARELRRLSAAAVQTVLVVGNHDQVLKSSGSHSMSVFQSLEIPNVSIIDRPTFRLIDTANGAFQLIGLPHVTRHQMMTLTQYAEVSAKAIDNLLIEHINTILQGYYQQLDPKLPAVATAHMTVDRAVAGIEQELLVGYTLTFPTDIFIDQRLDYVALGHVHRHQIVRAEHPAIVYAGSLERIDFGEESEPKGFVHVELQRGLTTYRFHSVHPREFITLQCDVSHSEDPTSRLCKLLTERATDGCVLRIRYKVRQDQLSEIDEDKILAACPGVLSVRLLPEILPEERRSRMPELTESSLSSPLQALDTYLAQMAPARKERLLARARQLMDD